MNCRIDPVTLRCETCGATVSASHVVRRCDAAPSDAVVVPDCVFDGDTCTVCGARRIADRQPCGFSSVAPVPRLSPPLPSGPGTELKALLAWFGIVATGDCACNARAAEMDARGPDWCEANIDTIVGWLREQAAERGLPFVDVAGRLLVRRAIRNARQKASRAASDGMPGPP